MTSEQIYDILSHDVEDPETGLYYYRARYYSPALGRFLQSDSVGYKDDFNLYAYVYNDPLDKTDPTGTTCTQSNGKYSCQVDSIRDAKGNVTQRKDFTRAQQKQVAAFEKSYTAAVNKLASNPSAKTTVSVPGGNKADVTAGQLTKWLADRNVVAAPSEKGGGSTANNTTVIQSLGLAGKGTLIGVNPATADLKRQIVITHEGLHDGPVDGSRGHLTPFEKWDDAHQAPYNQAAEQLLGIKDP